jgi:hypothetical protein
MARKPARLRGRAASARQARGGGKAKSAREARGRAKAKSARQARGRGKAASASQAAGARTARGKIARKKTRNPPRPGKRKQARAATRTTPREEGLEKTLAQTPETGRTVRGRTNPRPTKRSTGTAAGAGSSRRSPAIERQRKQLREVEESLPGPPSSLDMDRRGSAARTGRAEMREARREHTETSPAMTGGDVDADWEDAYAVGDEAPGGDNPTPDQDRVDDIGRALGIEYQDNEELKGSDKVTSRDKHRWELDPASSEDYRDRE